MKTEELLAELKKAGITTENTGGLLNAEQYNAFITSTIDQSAILKEVRVERDIATSRELHLMGTGKRLLRKGVEYTEPTNLAGITTEKKELIPVEVILPYDISLSYIEENIEKEGVEQTINNVFSKQFSNDLLDLCINGNKADAGADKDFLNIFDGWLKKFQADDNKLYYNRDGSSDWKGVVFGELMDMMPDKFIEESDLIYLVGRKVENEYRRQLGERVTVMGDKYLTERPDSYYEGIRVRRVPYLPYGAVMLTTMKNLAVGFGRNISVYKFYNGRKRCVEYTITTKLDANHVMTDKCPFTI